jgi:hypothetical protein
MVTFPSNARDTRLSLSSIESIRCLTREPVLAIVVFLLTTQVGCTGVVCLITDKDIIVASTSPYTRTSQCAHLYCRFR